MLSSNLPLKNTPASQPNSNSLPKKQRLVILSLSGLGLAVLFFWGWQFQARVSSPFKTPENQSSYAQLAAATDLTKDTDGDGLSDYEEITIYNTSPYLEDTDSDGISDAKEIQQGTNPNCPAGTDCGLEAITPPSEVLVSSTSPEDLIPEADLTLEEELVSGQISAENLRLLLLESGADASVLDQISDADLLQGYQEMLQAQLQEAEGLE